MYIIFYVTKFYIVFCCTSIKLTLVLVIEKLKLFLHKLTNKYIFMNHYETVFILNPVLSDVQVKETVSKFEDFLTTRGATMV
jgi:hypothetical protein